jgi:hypothetical protein
VICIALSIKAYLRSTNDHNNTPDTELCSCYGEDGHEASRCPHTRSRGRVTCYRCGEEGHIVRMCTKPKNLSKIRCRGCDEEDHALRDCTKPMDWSQVICTNCLEKGHGRGVTKQFASYFVLANSHDDVQTLPQIRTREAAGVIAGETELLRRLIAGEMKILDRWIAGMCNLRVVEAGEEKMVDQSTRCQAS